jgi:EAL domain-containing protein (putative c-di-GMP-specific phosphodiesterase class I)
VLFNYELQADELAGAGGTLDITARVTDEVSGWQRTIPMREGLKFTGDTVAATGSVNLCDVVALTDTLEAETEYYASYYTLQIVPLVNVSGTSRRRALEGVFAPVLAFRFDKQHFYLLREDEESDPLNPTAVGIVEGTRTEANTLPLLGLEPEVGPMRFLALAGLLLSGAGMLFLTGALARAASNKAAYVNMRYGSLLVEAKDMSLDHGAPVVELASIDDLARLADRRNTMILHEERGTTHYYLVQGDGTTYRYALNGAPGGLVEVLQAPTAEDLRRAFERGEFQVYYQPIMSLTDRRITGVEALLRWQHPSRGLVAARDFLPTAESTGLIQPIGEWMLKVACAQLKDWQSAGAPITLAVNLAESQLESNGVEVLAHALQHNDIDPRTLQVEIPEKGILNSADKVLPRVHELRNLGIQISIDNFHGQLPLSTIQDLPVNNVKLDRGLIQKLDESEPAAALEKIAAAARSAGMNVVAVGVETEAQLEQLRARHYAQAQGLLLGDPVPAGEITLMLLKASLPTPRAAAPAREYRA